MNILSWRERCGLVRAVFPVLFGMVLAFAAQAQPVGAPKLVPGDSWIYQHTMEARKLGRQQIRSENTVVRAESGSIVLSNRLPGSAMPPVEQLASPDWSRRRRVNGRETVVNQPLLFPMSTGQSWEIGYSEDHPNRQHSSEHTRIAYKVVG